MAGETNLAQLIKGMVPKLNEGEYVFASVHNFGGINREDTICEFKEQEGVTIVLAREKADILKLPYDYVASWITLTIHSSLDAVGLTAAFSNELARHNISCNVIAGFYHDHIFVDKKDGTKAFDVLTAFTKSYK